MIDDIAEVEKGIFYSSLQYRENIVYSIWTLCDECPDGAAFEGKRYIDQFFIQNEKIATMDGWDEQNLLQAHR